MCNCHLHVIKVCYPITKYCFTALWSSQFNKCILTWCPLACWLFETALDDYVKSCDKLYCRSLTIPFSGSFKPFSEGIAIVYICFRYRGMILYWSVEKICFNKGIKQGKRGGNLEAWMYSFILFRFSYWGGCGCRGAHRNLPKHSLSCGSLVESRRICSAQCLSFLKKMISVKKLGWYKY